MQVMFVYIICIFLAQGPQMQISCIANSGTGLELCMVPDK